MNQKAEAEARAFCYLLLSKLLLYPDEEALSIWRNNPEAKLQKAFSLLARDVSVAKLPPLGDETELQAAYARFFDQAQPSPLHEFTYRRKDFLDITALLADIAAFYRALGVRAQKERHDHLAAELEFMGLCCQRQAAALAEGRQEAKTCHQIASRFFSEHLGLFYSEVADALAGKHPVYTAVAGLVRTFLRSEATFFARTASTQKEVESLVPAAASASRMLDPGVNPKVLRSRMGSHAP